MHKNRHFGDPEYGTHMCPLTVAVVNTVGPILELGSGDYSTPLLHALCAKNKRLLVSTDTDKKWLDLFMDLERSWHTFVYISVYEDDYQLNPKPHKWDSIGNDIHWSVVFIDHRPGERRVEDIIRLRKNTDIFVVHDTHEPSYGYEPTLSSFKYRYLYERYFTTTTLVSDTVDVAQLFE